ncbi:MtrAB system accessory lipoprotein LpqB [Nocardia arizonensis]|uniref:MtrAB system accessory lipoprotein LpqB n=1 Tax=Nocardia arizonensis TaxID=1141647 RepID=UPI0006D130C4|nr:MtrAB system accessory lipoprotein LpqB [Nocardia arizonensis]
MTVHHRQPRRLPLLVGASILIAAVLSGCASLPESSAPQALGTINQQPTSEGPLPPATGRDPGPLLRDFLQATADPANQHAAARQYLTPDTAQRWDDTTGTVIVDRPDTLLESRVGDTATYRIRAQKVAEIAMDGGYRAIEGPPLEYKIEMSRAGGEWRITDLPDGVVMDESAFAKSYRRYVLYFGDSSSASVVPDLRWVSAPKNQLTQRLLGLMADGPQPGLASVVRNNLAPPVSLRGPITKANGDPAEVGVGLGGVRLDFAGASALAPRDKELLAAQVVLTLAKADVLGPYVLLGDGKPLDDRYAANGWSAADVQQFSPEVLAQNRVGLHALREGGLVQVGADVTAAPGYFGAVSNLQSAALTPDGQFVAAVADAGRPAPEPPRTLMVGNYGGTQFPVAEGTTISRPSWAADGSSAWAAIDGERIIRVVNDRSTGTVSLQDVDISGLTGGSNALRLPITEVRVSRTGARAVLIADGKVYVAIVVRQPDGKYALTSPIPVAVDVSTPAVSVNWLAGDTIFMAFQGNVDPVRTVQIDGSGLVPLTGRNLTAPVRSVSVSLEHQYVADSRAVLELTSNPDGGEPYWREVPGLGANAVPVLPG